ncbi:uncharacterized protein RCC_08866 [Ramularia collo-cygni]|uniref:Uncharacterized protein n=1 Tax=Ramularia collo-cygni TaxID=112498 RepID=A0A2D3V187_9PEZI|nr:uncharacterized protein RCC_08866 [Ramularia collo-cygni]CZT23156.1 uncharacterized protein RCC_08866 [Ramularia collo-cygni]
MASSACSALQTPELLELILLDSAMRTTTLSAFERVNKTFKMPIDTSPSLQRKLFMRQLPCPAELDPTDFWYNTFTANNIMLVEPEEGEHRSVRPRVFRLDNDSIWQFELNWVRHSETDKQWTEVNPRAHYQALRIAASPYLNVSWCEPLKLLSAFLKMHLTDIECGFVVDIMVFRGFTASKWSRMWAPAVTTVAGLHDAYNRWGRGELEEWYAGEADDEWDWE